MPPSRPEYRLTVRALPDGAGVPAVVRLRRLLKAMQRAYGFTCTAVEEITPAQPASTAGVSRPQPERTDR